MTLTNSNEHMLFNCSLSNSQLHFILKNSSGFHTQKQLQDLDQQRTGHGVAVTGQLWENVSSLEGWC